MANNTWRHPDNTQVQQVKTIVITADSTDNDEVWTLTLTNDDGSTETVSYTEDGSPTVAEIAQGLASAWNLSLQPHIAKITALYTSGGTFTLTADEAGVPFTVALADTGDGTHAETATTANVGNNDANTAANWELNAAPASTNDLIFNAGSVSLKYGLDQSAAAIADFRVFPGCSSQFGRFDNGKAHYLKLDPDLFRYEGSGSLAMFDIGSANIDCYVSATGQPTAGRHAVYLKGSNIATAYIVRGNVGIAPLDADSATVATVQVGYVNSQQTDARVTIGNVTLTTLNQLGGWVELRCAATTVNNGVNSTLETTGSAAITTLTANGTAVLDSTGTITNLHVYGTVNLARSRAARTVTNCTLYPGGRLIIGPWITLTNKVALASTGFGQGTVEFRQ